MRVSHGPNVASTYSLNQHGPSDHKDMHPRIFHRVSFPILCVTNPCESHRRMSKLVALLRAGVPVQHAKYFMATWTCIAGERFWYMPIMKLWLLFNCQVTARMRQLEASNLQGVHKQAPDTFKPSVACARRSCSARCPLDGTPGCRRHCVESCSKTNPTCLIPLLYCPTVLQRALGPASSRALTGNCYSTSGMPRVLAMSAPSLTHSESLFLRRPTNKSIDLIFEDCHSKNHNSV